MRIFYFCKLDQVTGKLLKTKDDIVMINDKDAQTVSLYLDEGYRLVDQLEFESRT